MARAKRHFTATHKSLSAEGATKSEASAKLEAMIDWALDDRQLHIECRFGWLIIISPEARGYASKLIHPSVIEHGIKYHAGCFHGQVDFAPLLQSCRNHAAQNAWAFDCADDAAHVKAAGLDDTHASELARWIAWQRRYSALKASGATDNEAHRQASGMAA